jgi:hypothetical protein
MLQSDPTQHELLLSESLRSHMFQRIQSLLQMTGLLTETIQLVSAV